MCEELKEVKFPCSACNSFTIIVKEKIMFTHLETICYCPRCGAMYAKEIVLLHLEDEKLKEENE